MVLSLFGGNLHLHHFATEKDVAEELFILLSEARVLYLQDVIANGKRYDRYVDDFINSHRYINCNDAVCRNCHEMNIHIVKGLLRDYAGLVRSFFVADTFSFDDCMNLKLEYNSSEPMSGSGAFSEEPANTPPLSFGCNFTREQIDGIVACASKYRLFCVSTLCAEEIEALFSCRKGFCIQANHIRRIAILFDALLENRLIQPNWQSVLDKGHFLLSKDGRKFVSASHLASALSATRISVTSVSLEIRKAVARLK